MKRSIFIFLTITALVLVGCTRSASRSPTGDVTSTPGDELPFPTPVPQDQQTGEDVPDEMSTAVAGGFATQTAIAAEAEEREAASATPEPTESQEPEEQQMEQEEPTNTPQPTSTPEPEVSAGCDSPYTVQPGDWVWKIGRRCDIHPDAIISANNLRWPYWLYPGQVLTLPDNAPSFP